VYFLYLTKDGGLDGLEPERVFEYAMRETYFLEGETDSNCNAVGGLMGALLGVDLINQPLL
jgi:hypothetical protein